MRERAAFGDGREQELVELRFVEVALEGGGGGVEKPWGWIIVLRESFEGLGVIMDEGGMD